jgi:hypothetical protein
MDRSRFRMGRPRLLIAFGSVEIANGSVKIADGSVQLAMKGSRLQGSTTSKEKGATIMAYTHMPILLGSDIVFCIYAVFPSSIAGSRRLPPLWVVRRQQTHKQIHTENMYMSAYSLGVSCEILMIGPLSQFCHVSS